MPPTELDPGRVSDRGDRDDVSLLAGKKRDDLLNAHAHESRVLVRAGLTLQTLERLYKEENFSLPDESVRLADRKRNHIAVPI